MSSTLLLFCCVNDNETQAAKHFQVQGINEAQMQGGNSGSTVEKTQLYNEEGGEKTMINTDVQITWSMSATPSFIKVDYVVHNNTDHPIWVADELLQNTVGGQVMRARSEVVVRNGDESDVVSFVRGMTPESLPGLIARPPPMPAVKQVAAQGQLNGTASIPLPLTAWHNYGRLEALSGDKHRGIFEVSYMDEPSADSRAFRQIPLEDSRTVPAPDPYYFQEHGKRVKSEIKPLS